MGGTPWGIGRSVVRLALGAHRTVRPARFPDLEAPGPPCDPRRAALARLELGRFGSLRAGRSRALALASFLKGLQATVARLAPGHTCNPRRASKRDRVSSSEAEAPCGRP